MRLYRPLSLLAAISFATLGLLFLLFPDGVLNFFNYLSIRYDLPQAAFNGESFYLALAAAYMYVVAYLAMQMYRHPKEAVYPFLLVHAKSASSLISLYLFSSNGHYLILLANFVVDGLIALVAFYFYRRLKAG